MSLGTQKSCGSSTLIERYPTVEEGNGFSSSLRPFNQAHHKPLGERDGDEDLSQGMRGSGRVRIDKKRGWWGVDRQLVSPVESS